MGTVRPSLLTMAIIIIHFTLITTSSSSRWDKEWPLEMLLRKPEIRVVCVVQGYTLSYAILAIHLTRPVGWTFLEIKFLVDKCFKTRATYQDHWVLACLQ